jgi:acetoin utilization deacetylase AcuC-like enzyme
VTTLLYTHSACRQHDPGEHHPESPGRLAAVLGLLDDPVFDALEWREAPRAETEDLRRVHTAAHVERVMTAVPTTGHAALDADTILSPGSGEAALHAAGAMVAAVDAVMRGEADRAFCAVRPPGHHAEPDRPMGFCLFNNVAIGAKRALDVHGAKRVAIIDFDVHHGNGSQSVAESEPRLFFASTHQAPLYPGTGAAHETGIEGNVVNVPLPPGADGGPFRRAYRETILPALDRFRPELILISAGFDAHKADPLAGLELDETDYVWVTEQLRAAADRHCRGRIVSTLEGGYNLRALATSTAAHVSALIAAV